MRYLLDTTVISDFVRGDAAVRQRLVATPPGQLAVSVITRMEIVYGLARNPARARRIEPVVTDLLGSILALPYGDDDAVESGRLRAALDSAGEPIGAYDALIAGTALARALTVITANEREFRRVRGLTVENWRRA